MIKFKLYTYDLWADQTVCLDCGDTKNDDTAHLDCDGTEHTSYSVNDVYGNEIVEAENMEEAIKMFEFKEDTIEIDNNVDNSETCYFRYISGKYNGSPACEIRKISNV